MACYPIPTVPGRTTFPVDGPLFAVQRLFRRLTGRASPGRGIVLEGTGESAFCRCSGSCALGLVHERCGVRRGGPDRAEGGHGGVRLGGSPVADEILPQLVEAVAKAMHLSYLAIEMMHAGSRVTVASYGRPSGKLAALPFTYEGETVAWMLFGQRSARRAPRKRACRALEALATPIGAVTRTLRQAVELQRLREELTAAREEERRRLRRDLHDGVAPSVAAAALHLQTAEELIRTDPAAAEDLIGRVRQGTKDVVEEIRRLADCLGHSLVDQVGLASAIRQRASCIAETMAAAASNTSKLVGPRHGVTVEAVGEVDDLPAATEAAAFGIVTEVLVALFRHGSPTSCRIRLNRRASDLEVEISVDGEDAGSLRSGLDSGSLGVRADALGGALDMELLASGTAVLRIRLPLAPA